MILRNCKKWIISSETLYWTNVQQSIVSNCVDLTHHFILKYTAYYYIKRVNDPKMLHRKERNKTILKS